MKSALNLINSCGLALLLLVSCRDECEKVTCGDCLLSTFPLFVFDIAPGTGYTTSDLDTLVCYRCDKTNPATVLDSSYIFMSRDSIADAHWNTLPGDDVYGNIASADTYAYRLHIPATGQTWLFEKFSFRTSMPPADACCKCAVPIFEEVCLDGVKTSGYKFPFTISK